MRTLNLALENNMDVSTLLEWVFGNKVSDEEIDDSIRVLRQYGDLKTPQDEMKYRRDVFYSWVSRVENQSTLVATAISMCTPDNECYGISLAKRFVERVFLEIAPNCAGETLRNILWSLADQFAQPEIPTNLMSGLYPGAKLCDDPEDCSYDTSNSNRLRQEERYYHEWYPRRQFYQEIYRILLG